MGNSIENFSGNDLVLLGSNLPHAWNTTEQEEPVTAIVIYLKEEFFDQSWMQSIEFESIRKLLTNMNKGIKVDDDVAVGLKRELF